MSKLAYTDNRGEGFQVRVPGDDLNHYVTFTNASSYTEELDPATTLVELFATTDCWVRLVASDSANTAAIPAANVKTSSQFLPGGITAFYGIPKKDGTVYKFAVIRNATDGNLYVSEGL